MLQNPDVNPTQTDAQQSQQTTVPSAQPQNQPAQPNPPQQPIAQQPTVSNPTATNSQPTQAPADTSNANHPLVKHASVLHDIAETLAGGPRFKPTIDPKTGKTTYQRVPLERKDVAMAIALSAIQGGLAGLQAKGPNASAQAAGLGFNATAQARQKADEEANKQAAADYARQAAIADTNFRLHQNATNLGYQDYEKHKEYVADHKSTYDVLSQVPGALRADNVRESDLTKYHVTKDTAIPVGVVPRLNADGS